MQTAKLCIALFLIGCISCKENEGSEINTMLTGSFDRNSEILAQEIRNTYYQYERDTTDLRVEMKAKIFVEKIKGIQFYSTSTIKILDSLNFAVKRFPLSEDKDVGNAFISGGMCKIFYQSLKAYRVNIITVLNASPQNIDNYWLKQLAFPLEDSVFESSKASRASMPTSGENFSEQLFRDKNKAAVQMLIAKFRNDLYALELQLLKICMPYTVHSADQISYLFGLSSSIIRAGDSLTIYGGVGEFYHPSELSIQVNDRQTLGDENGFTQTVIRVPKTIGRHQVKIKVQFKRPDGRKTIWSRDLPYEVVP